MLEFIAMTPEDAKRIEKGGGQRIELVSALTEGGLTPSLSMIEAVIRQVRIPVNVMIRPHAKSFNYSFEEIEIMVNDIEYCKAVGVNGVVFGVLDENLNIHEQHLVKLLSACEGLEITFHKAIDETNIVESVNVLNKYPQITNILTAGGKGDIIQNMDMIKVMLNTSKHINILVGGGLTHQNFYKIRDYTGATDFHFGTAVRTKASAFGEVDWEAVKEILASY